MNMGYMNMTLLILKYEHGNGKPAISRKAFVKVNTRVMFIHFFFSFKVAP